MREVYQYWPLIRLRGMRGSCFRIMWHEHDFFCQRLLGIKYTRMMDRICRLCFSSSNHLLFYCISYGHGGLDKKLLSFGDTCSFRPLCPDSVTLAVWLHAQSADLENQPFEPKHKEEREAGRVCSFIFNIGLNHILIFTRVGGREKYEHCNNCGLCLPKSDTSHNCRSDISKTNCPVCGHLLIPWYL